MQVQYRVIGLMSGSSLDGLDIAYCIFHYDGHWQFTIENACCVPYPATLLAALQSVRNADAATLWQLHTQLGHYYGTCVQQFINEYSLHGKIDLVASHGHTVFHFPQQRNTCQIGDGSAMSAVLGLPVVCDLRAGDVALGGQGAPIVPIADLLLFPDYALLLNLGGIANITCKLADRLTAFDISVCNQALNFYAQKKGISYDEDGKLARAGKLHQNLLASLAQIHYFKKLPPKSLDNGFTQQHIIPAVESYKISIEDKLHTLCCHIATQVAAHITMIENSYNKKFSTCDKLLATGGGALNIFLMEKIRQHCSQNVEMPDEKIVRYKEALAMAFMGVLRWRKEKNVLASVTGATNDSINGAIYEVKN